MKSAVPLVALAFVAGCSQPEPQRSASLVPGPHVEFTRQQIMQNRRALELTAAYRKKAGIHAETVVPGPLRRLNPVERMLAARNNPALVSDGPVLQGVDYSSPLPSSSRKGER